MCQPNYIICSCSLHNLQTCLCNAIVNVLGEGGEDDDGGFVMNCMQMLHGAYNLQNWAEDDELNRLYKFLDDDVHEVKFKKLEQPIVTHWWLVGACACSLKESFCTWKKICRVIRNNSASKSALYKLASCTLNSMQLPPVLFDHELLCAFHKIFLFPHFKFSQSGDGRSGSTPGFISRHIFVRFFLMIEDIEKFSGDKWKTEEGFKDVLSQYNVLTDNEKEIATNKIHHFVRYAKESLTNHFQQMYFC